MTKIRSVLYKAKNIPNRCFERNRNEMYVLFKRFSTEPIKVVPSKDTIEEVLRHIKSEMAGAFLRFGDGDIHLVNGLNDMLQKSSSRLRDEMFEAFSMSGMGIMKTAPLNCDKFGCEKGMVMGKHKREDKVCLDFLRSIFPFFIGQRIHSTGALHYCAEYHTQFCINFLRYLRSTSPILVGNKDIPKEISNVFLGAKKHIGTPSSNAYAYIDHAEQALLTELSKDAFQVVIVAMGCSGRILSKRILKQNKSVFLFDFGSLLDAISGWKTRTWIKLMDSSSLREIRNALLVG